MALQHLRVVQFGEGVFLRAFAEPLLQQIRDRLAIDIRVTLVQPRDSDTVARLMAQGGRYTLLEQGLVGGEERASATEIDIIDSGINTHTDPDAFVALARDPDVRVVLSNTTEAGIAWFRDDAALADRALARSFPTS